MEFNTIEQAVSDLLAGKCIVVCDDEDRENEGDLVALADFVTPEVVNFMAKEARGLICVPITKSIAERLKFDIVPKQFSAKYDSNFTVSVDHSDVTTGISVNERAFTIKSITDPLSLSSDFRRPGHIFPLVALDGGVLVRAGHTEASVDLALISGANPVAVICEIMNDDGSMSRLSDLVKFASRFELKIIAVKDLIEYRILNDKLIIRDVEVKLPTKYGGFRLIPYRTTIDDKVNLALIHGNISCLDPIPVRVHSECLTGDVFHSLRCDCGDQLSASMEYMVNNGFGVVLYMRQEGRGIGLLEKLRSYSLQDEGQDTVSANESLGYEPDLRHYGIGAQILLDLGLKKIKLLTNNPKKVVGIAGFGLEIVERVPIVIKSNPNNEKYLRTKKEKLGHLFDFDDES